VQYTNQCQGLGGTNVTFNDPCAWANGGAELTFAHFTSWCKGQTRVIHWHDSADEWGFVKRGTIQAYVVSPTGVPWASAINNVAAGGVWYFPQGWLHGLMCLTPESEGGCEALLVFRTPVAVPIDNHNLDTTLVQTPHSVGAQALDLSQASYHEVLRNFQRASQGDSPLLTMTAPELCEPSCPAIMETQVAAVGVNRSVEVCHELVGGARECNLATDQFPFATSLSQQRVQLSAGGFRPLLWCANCHGLLAVIAGSVQFGLQGGLAASANPEAAHELFNETLREGDIAYIPISRAYWVTEASGQEVAEFIVVWNVGAPQLVSVDAALQLLPAYAIRASLNSSAPTPAKGPALRGAISSAQSP